MIERMWRGILIFLLLSGCTQKTAGDFLTESEERCSELVAILEKAGTLDELMKAEPEIKKKFNEIAALMLQAQDYDEKHPSSESVKPVPSSGPLLDELRRIYSIKGGREVIERAQADARLW